VQELLAAGARKVYAAARNPESVTLDRVHGLRLDVTTPTPSLLPPVSVPT